MIEHDGVEHSGYMSFMIIFSIFPFFVFILAVTSFFGASELGEYFIQLTLENIPEHSLELIRTRIQELISSPPQELLTLAIVGSIWTASSFVECLRTILNRVYEIKSPPNYILRRLLSIAQFLLLSMMVSLAVLLILIVPILFTILPDFTHFFYEYKNIFGLIRYFVIFLFLFMTVCSLYYIIPNASLKFTEVVPGALLSVILWIICGYLLSIYVSYYNQLSIIYGSLGSIIIILTFFYLVNMIFIYGAEFNYLMNKKSDI